MQILFPEPKASDESTSPQGERPVDYLARSTSYKAREMRRFLNENISVLPEDAQKDIYDGLRNRYVSAFFELIVGRTLQALGACIKVENQLDSGKKPDFQAHFPDGTIIVEAASPNFCASWEYWFRKQNPLMDIIEKFMPEGWNISILQLPDIGPNDSKAEFKRRIKRMLDIPPPADGEKERFLYDPLLMDGDLSPDEDFEVEQIRLRLEPRKPASLRNITPGAYAYFPDPNKKLEQTLGHKRKQVRGAKFPVLLAVESSLTENIEDFDSAIYGRVTESFDTAGNVVSRFRDGGLFAGNKEGEPTFAGILAYRVGYTSAHGPVLYRHPRFSGQFPKALNRLERRRCADDMRIVSDPADDTWATDLSSSLKFVREE